MNGVKYNTFIFDFDYTLADATPGIIESMNYALGKFGFELKDRDSICKTVGMTLKDAFAQLTGVSDNEFAERFTMHFKDMADKVMTANTILFDDTIACLKWLKERGCKTAIVTSKLHYRIDDVLQNYNATELIDYIVGSEDVSIPKPSPEGLLNAITYLDAAKESTLYIGDTTIDANTALNASVDFAAVLTGTTTAEEFSGLPNICVVKSLKALAAVLDGSI
jgi:phosphoglycolate phosphatase